MSRVIPLGNPLIVTMGMGQLNNKQPALVQLGIIEYYQIVEAFVEALRGDGEKLPFDDDVDFYKIVALLSSVNSQPLNNPLYNKMSRLVFDRKIKLDVSLMDVTARKSKPYRIVIGEHRVLRDQNE